MQAEEPAAAFADFGELDLPDINLGDFAGIDTDTAFLEESRAIAAPRLRVVPARRICYNNARKCALQIDLAKSPRWDVIVGGAFIFGDFIEAFLTTHNVQAERLVINTLSVSQENIDSLHNLMGADYIVRLEMLVSDYYFAHERHNMIPYIVEELASFGRDRFALGVCSTHMKTITMRTDAGEQIVIHGSANLRSSGSIEQFTIEHNPTLAAFYNATTDAILQHYAATGESLRNDRMFNKIDAAHAKNKV